MIKMNQNTNNNIEEYQRTVCLAINYGARQDMLRACQALLAKQQQSDDASKPSEITLKDIENHLSTAEIPDPDLIIRTGGERRLSNFLLWESAYSELYFSNALWPDFDDACLQEALTDYHSRDRRYGRRDYDDENVEAHKSSSIEDKVDLVLESSSSSSRKVMNGTVSELGNARIR
eukprot:CAMPEP_0116015316 /NCGR_PEP_ID=MMETSP0321-20121206/6773_1 /TAXON_ID=163516 /ORGANISM="Leptocylindrus danicus var. danicus, Strain B650" /LENGTH=175 /DNA_ID=CAMNT_0003485081 /DNA_START=536 /DNA_END=1063 /DNA_ORIENTATION=+